MEAVKEILKMPFFEKSEVSTVDVKSKQAQCVKKMEAVNHINWQQLLRSNWIKDGDTKLEPDKALPDLESIWIGLETDRIYQDPRVIKLLLLPSINLRVNLYSMLVLNSKGEHKAVRKAKTNNRAQRQRPESSLKSDGSQLNLAKA